MEQHTPNLVQTSSLPNVRLHRLNFDIVLRKLIPKLQAFSKCIQESSMVQFYSSIYADDQMLISQMSRDSAFHAPPKSLPHIEPKTECLGSVPDRVERSSIRVRNSLFLVQRCGIFSEHCRNLTCIGSRVNDFSS
jgi:hypothetical protein